MNSSDFEIFYNWDNANKTNDNIQYRTIQSKIKPLIERNVFSSSEIEEILIADGYKEALVKDAVRAASNNNISEPVTEPVEVNVVPKKYSDISSKFEKVLKAQGPTKFVKLMTSGDNPLIKLSKKELSNFQKIADTAYENPIHLATLHAFMKPSVVSELAENVCRARKIKSNCSFSKVSEGLYKISHNGTTVNASIKPVLSSSKKFATSSYGVFGFPDEYVILAYEESSPYEKIRKDLAV